MKSDIPALQVQVVLKDNPVSQIWRLLWGLAASRARAADEGLLGEVRLVFGDCSDIPCFRPEDIADLTAKAPAAGLKELTYKFFGENLGHSGGHNRLAESGDGDLVMLLNPDTYPGPGLLRELLLALRDPNAGIVEARQIPLEHPKDFDPVTGETSWASGCCIAIRRSVFEAVGGFDPEHFPLHCDDVDLSWRVRLAGFKVVHVPRATVFHNKRIGTNGHPVPGLTEVYHGTLGRLLLAVKYARPDILKETAGQIAEAGSDAQKQALEEFRRRETAGALPAPTEGASVVAQFVGGEYAKHRF
jgi:hypothetical protein